MYSTYVDYFSLLAFFIWKVNFAKSIGETSWCTINVITHKMNRQCAMKIHHLWPYFKLNQYWKISAYIDRGLPLIFSYEVIWYQQYVRRHWKYFQQKMIECFQMLKISDWLPKISESIIPYAYMSLHSTINRDILNNLFPGIINYE